MMKKIALSLISAGCLFTCGCAQLVFVRGHEAFEVPQIYKMTAYGTEVVNITQNDFHNSVPDVSPDGTTLAFSSEDDMPPGVAENIYLMSVNGGERSPLTSGAFQKFVPRWGMMAYSDQIVFSSVRSNFTRQLYLVSTSGWLRLLTNPVHDVSDVGGDIYFSQREETYRVVFVRKYPYPKPGSDLFSIRVDGTGIEQITNTPEVDEDQPVVSPDGRLLAYRAMHMVAAADNIRILALDDWQPIREIKLASPAQINIRGIGWSRSGRRLYVSIEASDVQGVTYTEERAEIFSVKVDGTGQKRLTNNKTVDYWPNGIPCGLFWRPLCAVIDWFSSQ
jgi:Tol biopolymer transport system component